MNIIFDTSFVIEGLRQNKKAWEITAQFEKSEYKLFIPSIVGFELFSGSSSGRHDQITAIKKYLSFFSVVDLTWNIAQKAGVIYRDGITNLEVPDYIVAASALEIGAYIVTLNTKHFSQIPNLMIYPLNSRSR